ncbi:MAG: hypothetical protein ABI472_24225 [Ginsengibacter sp.]
MDINRYNYEEYFLLYADNELTDFEKAEVLMFLKENKDLDGEFRMILHTIYKPEANVELPDKSFLFRNHAASFINKKNYEEVFVLYYDNELTVSQKKDTENFLLQNAALKNEFELIGLARLAPEHTVVFADKSILYKKRKTGKVVPILFWRSLAAAVFIGFGLWLAQLYFEKPVAVTAKTAPAKAAATITKENRPPTEKPVDVVVASPRRNLQSSDTKIKKEKEKTQKGLLEDNNSVATIKTFAKTKKSVPEKIIEQVPEKINNAAAIVNDKIKNIPEGQITSNDKIEPSKELAQHIIQDNKKETGPVIYAQNASYVPNANDNNQNYVFYDITTEEFRKTKVGGFLKKVKRVIVRNNPISRLLTGDEGQVVSN